MMFEPNPLLNFSIDWRSKGLPYPPENHQHGSRNHGFTPLKGRPDDCLQIVEAADTPQLGAALARLNKWETAFFTTGCEKAFNTQQELARPIGYVEFCFNSVAQAK